MNIRMILFLCFYFSGSIILAMQQSAPNQLQFRKATLQQDLPQLLELINTHAVHDRNKIVILPEKFRETSLRSGIEKQSIFVAENQGNIIGYKKLFMLTDEIEKNNVLTNEIRCINNTYAFSGIINDAELLVQGNITLPDDYYRICIYNGADFTLPSYRGQGINQRLTNAALASLFDQTKNAMHASKAITMIYGLTKANAGEQPGSASDRTISISKSFKAFIQALTNNKNPIQLVHQRYDAFMPTFDDKSEACCPLPDDQSVPGYGCVLTYQLRNSNE